MAKVCIVTQHPFWLEPLGCGSLLRNRYTLLLGIFNELYIVFITKTDITCPLPNSITLKYSSSIGEAEGKALNDFFVQKDIASCYFSYYQPSALVAEIKCLKIIEIHDVMHLRKKQFKKFGYDAPFNIEKDEELGLLKQYDIILTLNKNEVNYLKSEGISHAIHLPPNSDFMPLPKNDSRLTAGMIASQASPNIDGLNCLLNSPISCANIIFAGPLCEVPQLKLNDRKNFEKLGFIGDVKEFYSKISVGLSPIRFGGGLKIKVFEALAYGRSVIASKHSVDGFPTGIEDVININDDCLNWTIEMLQDTARINSNRIQDYFNSYFSNYECNRILVELLK